MAMSMRERIAMAILKDLSDRRGIRHALECVDDDVMQEIREALANAVLSELEKPTEGMVKNMHDQAKWFGSTLHPDELTNIYWAGINSAKDGE
jgi:hypothetical protein